MSLGFFKSNQFKITNYAALKGCGKCRLNRNCNSPKMQPYGKGHKKILFLGEAPGEEEDEQGIPFIGKSGRFLDSMCRRLGLDPEKDIIKTNAVNCRPPKNRTPTPEEVDACRPNVWKVIKKHNPKVIVTLGAVGLQSIIGHRTAEALGSISTWRGWAIPDRELHCWVMPLFHPAYILRMEKNPAAQIVFKDDLKRAIQYLEEPIPNWKEEKKCVELLYEEDAIIKKLNSIKSGDTIVIDYETTGLKPHNEGHQIACIGIATGENSAFVFPTNKMQFKKALRLYRNICSDPTIKKVVQHLNYEDMWTRDLLHIQMEGWEHDTILGTHVLDCRKGICGLKFQATARTGLFDYSSHMDEYLHTDRKLGGNALNKVHKAPLVKLLEYCGIDTIATYRLFVLQQKQFEEIRKENAS